MNLESLGGGLVTWEPPHLMSPARRAEVEAEMTAEGASCGAGAFPGWEAAPAVDEMMQPLWATPPKLEVAPLERVRAPLAMWWLSMPYRDADGRAFPHPTWLDTAVTQHAMCMEASEHPTWDAVVGAGLIARFTSDVRCRQWIRTLSLAELKTIEDLACTEAHTLGDRLDELRYHVVNRPSWGQDLHEVMLARDDLEGVACLLREARHCNRLTPNLASLDWLGSRVAGMTNQSDESLVDERLNEVAIGDPYAWWVLPHLVEDSDPTLPGADAERAREAVDVDLAGVEAEAVGARLGADLARALARADAAERALANVRDLLEADRVVSAARAASEYFK